MAYSENREKLWEKLDIIKYGELDAKDIYFLEELKNEDKDLQSEFVKKYGEFRENLIEIHG
jgi:hypothetical protein